MQPAVVSRLITFLTAVPSSHPPVRQRRLRAVDALPAEWRGTRLSSDICLADGDDWDPSSICPGSDPGTLPLTWPWSRAQQSISAGCLAGNTPCAADTDCCSGVCTMHGRCGCFDPGHLCPSDSYCCGGVCREHRCQSAADPA